jgi:hypothetical protein
MLDVSKPSANRVNIELSGALDADAMRTALDLLIEKSEGITHGKMLYTISDFEVPTLGAMAVEFARMPKLFGLLGKFDKCAVLSEAGWIRTAAEIEGAIFPSLTIKSFSPSDAQAAEAWLMKDSVGSDDEDEFDNFPV